MYKMYVTTHNHFTDSTIQMHDWRTVHLASLNYCCVLSCDETGYFDAGILCHTSSISSYVLRCAYLCVPLNWISQQNVRHIYHTQLSAHFPAACASAGQHL
jgi:hypothetical protein